MIRLVALLAATTVLAGGCPAENKRPAAKAGKPDAALQRLQPTTHEACARITLPPADKLKEITLAGIRLVPDGALLRPAPNQKMAAPRLILGVLADTHQADEANLAQLGRLRKQLEHAGAHAIVVLGGLDSTYEGTRAALAQLKGKLPVLALPGDRASRSGFSGAVENLGQGFVDLTLARAVIHPAATLISVPGYHLVHNLRAAEQGCSYSGEDLADVATLAR